MMIRLPHWTFQHMIITFLKVTFSYAHMIQTLQDINSRGRSTAKNLSCTHPSANIHVHTLLYTQKYMSHSRAKQK